MLYIIQQNVCAADVCHIQDYKCEIIMYNFYFMSVELMVLFFIMAMLELQMTNSSVMAICGELMYFLVYH